MPRRTDSNNPADWLWISGSDLEGIRDLAAREIAYTMCHGKLAEVLEKVIKAELIRLGWRLEKTHDLNRLSSLLHQYASPIEAKGAEACQSLADVYFTTRYPGFDLEDEDWPTLRAQLAAVAALLEAVKARLGPSPAGGAA